MLAAGAAEAGQPAAADDEARCLALSMYWEAKNQGREGMIAVGSVVLNRVRHERFPDTVCEVVFEGGETPPCQFSWWCDGKSDTPTEPRPWALARELAERMLESPPKDPTRGALFFHADHVTDAWHKRRTRTARVGRHVYYR